MSRSPQASFALPRPILSLLRRRNRRRNALLLLASQHGASNKDWNRIARVNRRRASGINNRDRSNRSTRIVGGYLDNPLRHTRADRHRTISDLNDRNRRYWSQLAAPGDHRHGVDWEAGHGPLARKSAERLGMTLCRRTVPRASNLSYPAW